MYFHNQIPILILHVLEADIAENAGIVDQDIDAAEGVDGGLDNVLAVLDRVVVGYCISASLLDLLYYSLGCLYRRFVSKKTLD